MLEIILLCIALIIVFILGLVVGHCLHTDKKIDRDDYNEALSEHLQSTASYSVHLSNVISGINHEVSPWIGGIMNIISRLQATIGCQTCQQPHKDKILGKLESIHQSCSQTKSLLSILSQNVKRLNQYNNQYSNILSTIESWVNITLMDRFIKDLVDENNFIIDRESLNWETNHSPMLLAQVILNLVKNSIEHNPDKLDTLKIEFEGDSVNKRFIYRDNGKGIQADMITKIFEAGITSKNEKSQHGFGLALCMEYCTSMGANLRAVHSKNGAVFEIIFEESNALDCITDHESSDESLILRRPETVKRTIAVPQDLLQANKGDANVRNEDMSSMPAKGARA